MYLPLANYFSRLYLYLLVTDEILENDFHIHYHYRVNSTFDFFPCAVKLPALLCTLTSVNSLMLMLLACFATFLFTSSKAMLGWAEVGGGLLVMEGSGSSEDKPMLDNAAVMVAIRKIRDAEKENKTRSQ